jgi:hypothetical protein
MEMNENDSKILRAAADSEGCYVYEAAWMMQTSPSEMRSAVERLDERGYVVFDHGAGFFALTRLGRQAIRRCNSDLDRLIGAGRGIRQAEFGPASAGRVEGSEVSGAGRAVVDIARPAQGA